MSAAEVTTLTENYKKLQHDVNEARQSLVNMQSSLRRIEQGLFGDEEISHIGVIQQLQIHRDMIQNLKHDAEVIRVAKEKQDAEAKLNKWWITGIASAIGGGIMWLINYITK